MLGPFSARLPGNRLHLQHGPIDLIIEAFGEPQAVELAYHAAVDLFVDVLPELVKELPQLRQYGEVRFKGAIAQRMARACRPYARTQFITPMAAVAGSVADYMLQAMTTVAPLQRAYVNNGGDIAVHLAPGQGMDIGIIGDQNAPQPVATARIESNSAVRGIATSGRGGRSFSLGIADSVTVLAHNAAAADAAATMIANAVTLDHPAIRRQPANSLDPDSDLGDRLVTIDVGTLPPTDCAGALARGADVARHYHQAGLIESAFLSLQGQSRIVGPLPKTKFLEEVSA
ncbi:MAG: UPF0280 family protein [Alphaproteobacteria bacterium]|nr:UPF0280 family protein [Alphaproteobacteria bacterium]